VAVSGEAQEWTWAYLPVSGERGGEGQTPAIDLERQGRIPLGTEKHVSGSFKRKRPKGIRQVGKT